MERTHVQDGRPETEASVMMEQAAVIVRLPMLMDAVDERPRTPQEVAALVFHPEHHGRVFTEYERAGALSAIALLVLRGVWEETADGRYARARPLIERITTALRPGGLSYEMLCFRLYGTDRPQRPQANLLLNVLSTMLNADGLRVHHPSGDMPGSFGPLYTLPVEIPAVG